MQRMESVRQNIQVTCTGADGQRCAGFYVSLDALRVFGSFNVNKELRDALL